MLSKIDTVLKRIVKNKQQVLCLSITFTVTILISLHLLPSNFIKNVDRDNKTIQLEVPEGWIEIYL